MVGRPLRPNALLQFVQSLQHGSKLTPRDSRRLRLSVCVSGGPDSMALAYLLKGLEGPTKIDILGLIVDHRARTDSTDEACQVQVNLAKIGVQSSVLTMSWPINVKPLDLTDFESQARIKRYDLLAKAALENDVEYLLLGHHQDDQVETVLMRLIRNRNMSLRGIAGMAVSSSVPSAFDVFGVHVRQPISSQSASTARRPPRLLSESVKLRHKRISPSPVVSRGITLQRPLLGFSKADLVATCLANNVPYVIDPTNKDPQTSLRNAVRHLRNHHNLPEALHSARVLNLQQIALKEVDRIKQGGKEMLSACNILGLDLRIGTVEVKIPYMDLSSSLDTDACAHAVGKLAEIVTPNIRVNHSPQIPPQILTNFCNPARSSSNEASTRSPPRPFVIDKVQFTPHRSEPQRWTLSRQPMRDSEIEANTRTIMTDPRGRFQHGTESEYRLWDNRFWVRMLVKNTRALSDLTIRPLRPSDMPQLTARISRLAPTNPNQRGDPLRDFNKAAPGKTRYTLPVLSLGDSLLALPTFNYCFYDALEEARLLDLRWDVCYNAFSLFEQHPDFQTEKLLSFDKRKKQ